MFCKALVDRNSGNQIDPIFKKEEKNLKGFLKRECIVYNYRLLY